MINFKLKRLKIDLCFIFLILPLALTGCLGKILEPGVTPINYVITLPNKANNISINKDFKSNRKLISSQIIVVVSSDGNYFTNNSIPIQLDSGEILYWSGAVWAVPAPLMFKHLLVESCQNSQKLVAGSDENVGFYADYRLLVSLREFTVKMSKPGANPSVSVSVLAQLVDIQSGKVIASLESKNEQPAANQIATVITAYQKAGELVINELVDWTVKTLEDRKK